MRLRVPSLLLNSAPASDKQEVAKCDPLRETNTFILLFATVKQEVHFQIDF